VHDIVNYLSDGAVDPLLGLTKREVHSMAEGYIQMKREYFTAQVLTALTQEPIADRPTQASNTVGNIQHYPTYPPSYSGTQVATPGSWTPIHTAGSSLGYPTIKNF
jgi:hypothetical protein